MKKYNSKKITWWHASIIGVAIAAIISIALLIALTSLINNSLLALNKSVYAVIAIQLVSSFAASVFACGAAGDRKTLSGILAVVGYAMALCVVSLLFMDGLHGNVMLGLLALAAGAILGLLPIFKKTSYHKISRKRAFR